MNETRKKNSKGYTTDRGTSSRKGKSGKKNKTFKSKEAKFDEAANHGQTKASNDPSWYGADSPLMQNAANLSFAQMAGMPFNWKDATTPIYTGANDGGSVTTHSNTMSSLTGIAVMEYVPMPGILNDWTAPFNVAIRDTYTWIRKSQSGAKNYNAADLGHYVMAYDSALIVYAWMVRLYGMIRMVVQRNRFTPKAALAVMGVNYEDLVAHATSFRFYINSYAARLNAMKMPAVFDYFKRHMWLTSNIFADAPLQTAQLIVPVASHVWKYDIDEGGANLIPVRLGATGTSDNATGFNRLDDPWGYSEIVEFAEAMLNILLNNEDFNIMSGDILKAYEGNVFSLSFIGEDYTIAPVYDPEFNLQFHNASFFVVWDNMMKNWSIHEDTSESTNVGALVTNISGPFGFLSADGVDKNERMMANGYLLMRKIIDMPVEQPTPKDVAIATRFALAGTVETSSITPGTTVTLSEYGTEIPTRLTSYHLDPHDGSVTDGEVLLGVMNSANMDDYSKFSNAPLMPAITYRIDGSSGGLANSIAAGKTGKLYSVDWIGDFDHFALVDAQTLRNIHTAALFGLYGLAK